MFARGLIRTFSTFGLGVLLMLCAGIVRAHEGPHGGNVTVPVSSPEIPLSPQASDVVVTTLLPWCPSGGSGGCCCKGHSDAAPTQDPSFLAPIIFGGLFAPTGRYDLFVRTHGPVYSKRILIHSSAPRAPPALL